MKGPARLLMLSGVLLALGALAFIWTQVKVSHVSNEITQIQAGVAVRCVNGDDKACDRLRNRLIATADLKERKQLRRAIEKGVGLGGGNQPSGQPGADRPLHPRQPKPAAPVPTIPVAPPVSPGNSQICISNPLLPPCLPGVALP
jgi:hypothetical protein